MTPPGPHAMTAQAGAVGAWIPVAMLDPNKRQSFFEASAFQVNPDSVPLYTTPPAAVPVEALEGLVAELMTRVEADKAQCTNDDGSYRSDAHRAAWNFADGLEHAADKVYELIKERSNG